MPATGDRAWWDGVPNPVMLLSPGGELLQTNAAFDRAWSRPRAGGTATLQGHVRPEARAALQDRLAAHGDFAVALAWDRRGDEPQRWVDCVARWLGDAGHYLAVLHDVSATRRADGDARAQAERFKLLADNVPALIAYYDVASFLCLFANRQYAQVFGLVQASIVGRRFEEVIGPAAAQEVMPHVQRMLEDRLPVRYERVIERDEGVQWLDVQLLPHLGADGAAVGAFVMVNDITRHRLGEQALRRSEERLARFVQASAEGIVFHRDGIIADVNQPACDLVGYRADEMIGRPTTDFVAPEQMPRVLSTLAAGGEVAYQSVALHKDGSRVPVEFIARSTARNGEHWRLVIVRDLRARQAAQARIHRLAHHDALTGLPNRVAFMERLEQRLLRVDAADEAGGDRRLAVLFIDLDHFKRVNDSLGHLAGDGLLQIVAEQLRAALPPQALLARFGGDEFVALLPTADRREAQAVAQHLLGALEPPLTLEGRLLSVTPSIGLACYPDDGHSATALIKNADHAMYGAKAAGRAAVRSFDPAMAEAADEAMHLEAELGLALARGEFELHLQPQVGTVDDVVYAAQAQLRWHHPQRGLVGAEVFAPLATSPRLMRPVNRWLLQEALVVARRWADRGLALTVAVSLSEAQFRAAAFAEELAQMLAQAGVGGRALELELTERMLMDDLVEVRERLHGLKALGARLAIVHFGSGHSSLGHLKTLPIDTIRIAPFFIAGLPDASDSQALVRAIVQIGHSLGMAVVAEGVAEAGQRACLAQQGCDGLQGPLVAPALGLAAFEAWLQQRVAP
jgi:diguanylate cyclase (GGDEF)-like protein/PAS domain S-box-containing protein